MKMNFDFTGAMNKLLEKLEGWLVSDRARELIDGYEIGGEQLFVFNAE